MYAEKKGECEDCGKQKFPSEKQARAFLRYRFKKAKDMSVYRCGAYWHIGHHYKDKRLGKESRKRVER
jgi:hypothetical protein